MEVRMKHNSCRKALVFVLFASILISFAAFSTFASNPAGVPSDYEYVGHPIIDELPENLSKIDFFNKY